MEFNRFTVKSSELISSHNNILSNMALEITPASGSYVLEFRIMVGAGLLLILISLFALFIDLRNLYDKFPWFFKLLPFAIALPYIANTTGWILTELGRYPWVVYQLVRLKDGVSKVVPGGAILTSLIASSSSTLSSSPQPFTWCLNMQKQDQ